MEGSACIMPGRGRLSGAGVQVSAQKKRYEGPIDGTV